MSFLKSYDLNQMKKNRIGKNHMIFLKKSDARNRLMSSHLIKISENYLSVPGVYPTSLPKDFTNKYPKKEKKPRLFDKKKRCRG